MAENIVIGLAVTLLGALEQAPDPAGRVARAEQRVQGPLPPSHQGGYNSVISSLSTWT